MEAKLCATEEESIGNFMDLEDSPRYIYRGGALRGALNELSEYHALENMRIDTLRFFIL